MDTSARRVLVASVLLLTTLGIVLSVRGFASPTPAAAAPGRFLATIDRGGLIRFNNGKAGVETPFQFSLAGGPLQVPRHVDPWEGIDFPLNLAAYTSLYPEVIINRTYRDGARDRVYFTAVGSDTSRKLHRPEVCYRAANWSVTDLPLRTIRLEDGEITLNQFIVRDPVLSDERLIVSWYLWRDGRRRIEDGAFVMHIGVPIEDGQVEKAGATGDSFIRELFRRRVDRDQLVFGMAS